MELYNSDCTWAVVAVCAQLFVSKSSLEEQFLGPLPVFTRGECQKLKITPNPFDAVLSLWEETAAPPPLPWSYLARSL